VSTTWRPVAGVEVYLHSFLTSAVDGGEWSTSRPGRFTPLKERWYVSNSRLGMPQSQSRRFGEVKILLPRAESQTSVHRAPSCSIGCCICLVVFNDVRDKQNCTRWRSHRSVVHRYHSFDYFAHVLSWDVFHMLYKAVRGMLVQAGHKMELCGCGSSSFYGPVGIRSGCTAAFILIVLIVVVFNNGFSNDSLRAGRYGDRIPVGARFSAPPPDRRPWGPPSLLYNGYLVSFPGMKRPGRGVDHPPSSSARVKERVELCLYSPSGPSWPVLGRTLPLTAFGNTQNVVYVLCL
jgi:hypothetical protein